MANAHGPEMEKTIEKIEAFWLETGEVIAECKSDEVVSLIGDLNVQVDILRTLPKRVSYIDTIFRGFTLLMF